MIKTTYPLLEDPAEATRKSKERSNWRLWNRPEVTEEEKTERARAIAASLGKGSSIQPAERGFKGGEVNASNYNWLGSSGSADAEMMNAMQVLRARGRDIEENNPYGERFLAELEANVLGPDGMTMQAQAMEFDPTQEGLPDPRTKKPKQGAWVSDEVANDKIETAWADWKQSGICDVSGDLSFHEIERLMLRSTARDGHALCRIVRFWDGNKHGIALQVIESDALDHTYNASLPNGNIVVCGVEMDKWRRRVAYHILTRHPGDFFLPRGNAAQNRERVDASEIIHLRFLRRIGQTLGVSWFAPVINSLEMLNGYEEAELISARAESCKGGFLYSDIVPEGGFAGKLPDPTGIARKKLSPGQIDRLPFGVKFQAHNPTHPNGNYATYRDGVLKGIASGLSVSYNILANDLRGVSYSSLRGGLLDERETYKMQQAWFIVRFEMAVFRAWLESAMIHRTVALPFEKFAKFNNPYFQGRRWAWVDPQKDIMASILEVQHGFASRREIIAGRGGYIVDVAREQQADRGIESAYGCQWTQPANPAVAVVGDFGGSNPTEENLPTVEGEPTEEEP